LRAHYSISGSHWLTGSSHASICQAARRDARGGCREDGGDDRKDRENPKCRHRFARSGIEEGPRGRRKGLERIARPCRPPLLTRVCKRGGCPPSAFRLLPGGFAGSLLTSAKSSRTPILMVLDQNRQAGDCVADTLLRNLIIEVPESGAWGRPALRLRRISRARMRLRRPPGGIFTFPRRCFRRELEFALQWT